jgi:hypothetical protein
MSSPSGGEAGNYLNIHLGKYTTGKISVYIGTTCYTLFESGNVGSNTWYHYAICRSGTNTRAFLNGVQQGSTWTSDTTNYIIGANAPFFGGNTPNLSINGGKCYFDDIRITTGVARYTANFTPRGTAFDNPVIIPDPYGANVSLLLHFDGTNGSTTFTDSSLNPKTVTPTSVTVSTAQSKFGAASATPLGYSNSRLTVSGANADCSFGTGDFTIEMWVYPTSQSTVRVLYDDSIVGAGGIGTGVGSIVICQWYAQWNVYLDGAVKFGSGIGSSTLNTWQHVALTRSGTAVRLFVGGTLVSSFTSAANLSCPSNRPLLCNGSDTSGNGIYGWPFTGYMDDLRVTKGVARYTTNFTPLTAAFTNPIHVTMNNSIAGSTTIHVTPHATTIPCTTIDPYAANVVLLMHCEGTMGSTSFTDSSPNPKTITATAPIVISPSRSKFGTSSAYASTMYGYLSLGGSSDFAFGTGDFTVEFWMFYYEVSAG